MNFQLTNCDSIPFHSFFQCTFTVILHDQGVCLFFILLLDIKKLFSLSLFVLIYYYYFGCVEIEFKFFFVCFFSLFFISLRIQFFNGIIILTKSRQKKKLFLPFKMNRIGRSSIQWSNRNEMKKKSNIHVPKRKSDEIR